MERPGRLYGDQDSAPNNGDFDCNDLTEMDYGAVVKALMARQKPRLPNRQRRPRRTMPMTAFAIPAQLRRRTK